MGKVIAGIYEIEREIGSGGGGIVYLGRHLRLQKQIVLKADKRTLKAGTEALRREVDMLKGLSNTYLPQVYDFVQEDSVVYTIMDYVEGESLDRRLKRGDIPSQSEVIRWGCQLLEALNYMHTRKPYGVLHGDIKPANIMVRPNGSVCLIDFNIALALNEDGAVKVGFNRGYASPEHYGISYVETRAADGGITYATVTAEGQSNVKGRNSERSGPFAVSQTDLETEAAVDTDLETETGSALGETYEKKEILLDARSDIYSLGATLYHLVSGQKPAQYAIDVKDLDNGICRPEFAVILKKAMAPVREKRFQTADEMLTALMNITKTDSRTVRHKSRIRKTAAVISMAFIVGGVLTYTGMRQIQQRERALTLAEYSANALAGGNRRLALEQALEAIPDGKSIFDAPVTAEAQYALAEGLGIYHLEDSFVPDGVVALPSAPFDICMSPNGERMAVLYAYEAAVFDTKTKEKIVSLPTQESALCDLLFVNDHAVLFAGKEGITLYDLTESCVKWTGEEATKLAVSEDGTKVAAVNRNEERVILYNIKTGEKITERLTRGFHLSVPENDIFADAERDIFALSEDGRYLAMSSFDGAFRVFDLKNPDEDMIVFEPSDYRCFEGGFYGKYLAFSASDGNTSLFQIVDMVGKESIGGYETDKTIHVLTDASGIYVSEGNLLVQEKPEEKTETELAFGDGLTFTSFSVSDNYVLAATDNNTAVFFGKGAVPFSSVQSEKGFDYVRIKGEYAAAGNRNNPEVRILKLKKFPETTVASYDPLLVHDEVRICPGGKTFMLFDIHGFYIVDQEGMSLANGTFPDSEKIYDQQFRRENGEAYLEVIWYDGTRRCYSADTGEVIAETRGKLPQRDLYEEFETAHYRVTSPLHGTPEVYELSSGKKVASLDSESYLTYFTELDNGAVAEYVNDSGERFAYLLDKDLRKIAYLPALCDVDGKQLLFDCRTGEVRESRIYSLEELVEKAEQYIHTY